MLKDKLATINKELAEINVPIFCGLDGEGFPRYLDSISIITDDDNNTVIGISVGGHVKPRSREKIHSELQLGSLLSSRRCVHMH